MTVLPIGLTAVDWKMLLGATHAALRRSVAAPLDKRAVSERGVAQAVAAYGEFRTTGVDYTSVLHNPGPLLRHFSASFLITLKHESTLLDIATDGDLEILTSDENPLLFIASASLESWRNTIIGFSTRSSTPGQREFAGEALKTFDRLGLGRLWEAYSREGGFLTEKR